MLMLCNKNKFSSVGSLAKAWLDEILASFASTASGLHDKAGLQLVWPSVEMVHPYHPFLLIRLSIFFFRLRIQWMGIRQDILYVSPKKTIRNFLNPISINTFPLKAVVSTSLPTSKYVLIPYFILFARVNVNLTHLFRHS